MTDRQEPFAVAGRVTTERPHAYRATCRCSSCLGAPVPQIHVDDLRLLADTCQYSKSSKTREAAERIQAVLTKLALKETSK